MGSNDFPDWFVLECKMTMSEHDFNFWFRPEADLYKFTPFIEEDMASDDFLTFEGDYYADVSKRFSPKLAEDGVYEYVIETNYNMYSQLPKSYYLRIVAGDKVEVDMNYFQGVFN